MSDQLRILRRHRRWTLAQACERVMRLSGIEIAPSTLSEYESGITQPSLAKARALAKLYTCSVERLFSAKLLFQEKTKGVNDATE